MISSTEEVISLTPVLVRRTIRWSECDPTGVVYVGNFPGIMLSALYYFRRVIFESGGKVLQGPRGFQTPAKAIAQVFKSSLRPGDVVDIAAYAGHIGATTYDAVVLANRHDDGRHVFYGRVTSIFVSATDRQEKCPIPKVVTQSLAHYRERHPAPDVLLQAATWLRE